MLEEPAQFFPKQIQNYETFLGYRNKIIIISASSQIMSSRKYKNNKNS
jgi:hypothetical protein